MAELGDNLDLHHDQDLDLDSRCWSTGDPQLDRAVHKWLSWDKNCRTRAQVASLVAVGRHDELRARLLGHMTFGTAGLRAPMGAGFSRINDLTVIQATQGLHAYLSRCFADLGRRGVVIGYDTRGQAESGCTSRRLANLTAAVLLSKGVPSHLFSTPVPTPYVPFGVKTLGAAAGVMITASHNPKEDNGYKVYWCNGAQICSPRDKEILRSMEENLEPWSASCWEEEVAASSSSDPLERVNRCYMEQLHSLCFHRDANASCPLRVVHSAFHGVGHAFVQEAFRTFNLPPPIAVPEQMDPDPNFPSVSSPNPEEGEPVLKLALLLAERVGAQLVLATDPDADRLAVAERRIDGCGWKVFTGNEVAALLGWWMFSKWRETHGDGADVHKVFMLATTVSSKILQTFARAEGFQFEETLPGFKWIGNRIQQLTEAGNEVLFSFEESIGFLCGSLLPEKDGVSSAAVVAEMAAHLHSRKLNLQEQLHNIYLTYGHHVSRTSYVLCHDPPTIQRIFSRLRSFSGVEGSYPQHCGGVAVLQVRDVTKGYDSSQPDHRSVLPVTRNSHMITFSLQNGVVATLRTSGTEPKIKVYGEYCAAPGVSDAATLEAELQRTTAALLEEFLEPEKNKLIHRRV